MAEPIKCTPATMEYVRRLIDAGDRIGRDLDLTGPEVTQGAAVFAGMIAQCNAKAGQADVVGMISAEIVMRLASGKSRTIN